MSGEEEGGGGWRWFHWRDGWYFARQGEGAVGITKRDRSGMIEAVAVIPAGEWASIIAHVSTRPEDYGRAEEFHGPWR